MDHHKISRGALPQSLIIACATYKQPTLFFFHSKVKGAYSCRPPRNADGEGLNGRMFFAVAREPIIHS